MTYVVRLIPESEGGYSVVVPGLPGCASQGENKEEALQNIADAIREYLEVVREVAEAPGGEAVEIQVA